MNLLIALITYNRLAYTKRTLANLLETITVPHFIVASDNASTDGTQDWLTAQQGHGLDLVVLNPDNYYPGKACNIAWEKGLEAYKLWPTHLMRIDNDMELAPGWCERAQEYFKAFSNLGQLGLDYTALKEDRPVFDTDSTRYGMTISRWPGCVGGTHIMSRAVWDYGIRYDEKPWSHTKEAPTPQEDTKLSVEIAAEGWEFGHMTERYGWTYADESTWDEYPDYYVTTLAQRGYRNMYHEFFEQHEQREIA